MMRAGARGTDTSIDMIRNVTFAFAIAFLSSTSHAADDPPACFAAREKIYANDVDFIGYLRTRARVSNEGGGYRVSFSVSMPDSPQVLSVSDVAAVRRGATYRFRFVDGWGNKGIGRLVVSAKRAELALEDQEVADGGNNILRNYGTYTLKPARCAP